MKKKMFAFLCFVMCLLAMSTVAFAATTTGYDMTDTISSSISDMSAQIFAIIGVVVPAVLAIVGAKIAISKGLSIFKSLTSKG